jgi:sugar/nucleoside kinase (ribokinase family)
MQGINFNPLTRASFASQESHSLAVIGNLAIDTIIHPDFQLEKVPGGSAAAVATASVQLGIDTSIQSKVGGDFPSEWLVVLENLGIDISSVKLEDKEKTLQIKMEYGKEGDLKNITYNDKIKEGLNVSAMPKTEAVHICPAPPSNQAELVKSLKNRGEILSINFSECHLDELQKEDFFNTIEWKNLNMAFFNKKEAQAISKESEVHEMVRKFHDAGVDVVSITLGSEGALVFDGQEMFRSKALDVEVVDPTGCGDSFIGGFLGEYLKTKNVQNAQGMGTYMASLTAQKKGSWAALITDF